MSTTRKISVRESEEELISKAQDAVSRCNWIVGECAAKWTTKYAKGKTDADFAMLIGMTGDQVFQRRRVWETFGDVFEKYESLKWSHFYVALNWDDAAECLQWAQENKSTVAEMKVWRRASRGEELTDDTADDDWGGASLVSYVPSEMTAVRDPGATGREERSSLRDSGRRPSKDKQQNHADTVSAVARDSDESASGYSPYRKEAGQPAPRDNSSTAVVDQKPRPSAEQMLKRMTLTLERMNHALTPDLTRQYGKLPDKLRSRFVQAVGELSSKAATLL
jgi:hypothetical protein